MRVVKNPLTGKEGWWPKVIGPGLPIDTDKFFCYLCQCARFMQWDNRTKRN